MIYACCRCLHNNQQIGVRENNPKNGLVLYREVQEAGQMWKLEEVLPAVPVSLHSQGRQLVRSLVNTLRLSIKQLAEMISKQCLYTCSLLHPPFRTPTWHPTCHSVL